MTKTETLELIRGEFSPVETKDILMGMLRSKINFHNLRNWSSEERYGVPDLFSKQRVAELKELGAYLESYIAEARLLNKNIRIEAAIDLSLVD